MSVRPPVSQEGRGYYEQTGVGPLPVVMYNGMPFQREQLDPDELETVTMHKILEHTTLFQRAVYLVRTPCMYTHAHTHTHTHAHTDLDSPLDISEVPMHTL